MPTARHRQKKSRERRLRPRPEVSGGLSLARRTATRQQLSPADIRGTNYAKDEHHNAHLTSLHGWSGLKLTGLHYTSLHQVVKFSTTSIMVPTMASTASAAQANDPPAGTVTLFGSGELSPALGKAHRAVFSRISGPVQAVFLDTPAGFEPNADQISARAVAYFEKRLRLDLSVATYKSTATATPTTVESALRKLRRANYIFAGPGSPTYAIRNWRGTSILGAIARRLAEGAHLAFASAASIAMGYCALPVYEIYKVGEELRWVEGLNLVGPYGLDLAIVPHWNNTDGGTHDTRYCYMGESRMRCLAGYLPDATTVLGIDEYTACTVDFGGGQGTVIGAGQVTIRQRGRDDRIYPADTSFPLDMLRAKTPPETVLPRQDMASGTCPGGWVEWPPVADGELPEAADPYIDLLIEMRARLRADKQWALADEIRQQLAELGIALEDSPTGTTWRRT